MEAPAAPTPAPTTASPRGAWMMRFFEWLMVPIVLALGFMLASFTVRNADFWMHLATGRLIADGKYHFGQDPFSFATQGRTWVNHSWLYDLASYEIYKLDDSHTALVYIKAGLVALLALVMLLACRPDPDQVIAPGAKANPGGWVAAILVSLGLIAASTRFLLQPTVLSYLFLAATYLLLNRSRWWTGWALPVALAILFIVWVNCDAWFFLGPALVALFLIGDAFQAFLPSREHTPPARVSQLAIALGVALAACLINPHHYRVFTVLPTELDPNIVRAMQTDPTMRGYFVSPLFDWVLYINPPGPGESPPGYCFLALLGLVVASFGLNFKHLRLSLILATVGVAALALWNWRLIPFFAVVGAPIAVWNVRAFFAHRSPRPSAARTAPIPEPAPMPAPVGAAAESPPATAITAQKPSEAWWPGAAEPAAATAVHTAPASAAKGSAMTVTPESIVAFAGVFGRFLTILLGLGALAMTFPGWMYSLPGTAQEHARRVSRDIKPDPAYVQLAEKIHSWHEQKLLPENARGLALQLEVPSYLAWYAPEARTFMDFRFALLGDLSDDFMKVRKGLSDYAANSETSVDWSGVLRSRDITYVIVTTDPGTGGELVPLTMMADDQRWVLWFQNGRTTVFGWNVASAERVNNALHMNLVDMAFGPNAERLPPEATGELRLPPADQRGKQDLLERYLAPPPNPPPPSTEAARLYWQMYNIAFQRSLGDMQQAFAFAFKAHQIGVAQNPLALLTDPQPPDQLVIAVTRQMAGDQPVPNAAGLLAVREARRGILAQPNEGYPYLVLGMAYDRLPSVGYALRPLQQTCTFHQALDRLTPEQVESNPLTGALVSTVHRALYDMHRSRGQMDLAEEHLTRCLELYDRHPPIGISESEREPYKKYLEKELEKLRADLGTYRDTYQINLDKYRQLHRPLADQVKLALGYGQVREALKLLEESNEQADLVTTQQLIQLYLALGRVESAQTVLNDVPPQARPEFAQLQLHTWIAAGEYALAGKAMEQQLETYDRMRNPKARYVPLPGFLQMPNARLTPAEGAAFVFEQLNFFPAEPAAQMARLVSTIYGMETYATIADPILRTHVEKAELLGMRAMLALEEGDIATARRFLKEALDQPVPPANQAAAKLYLRFIDAASRK